MQYKSRLSFLSVSARLSMKIWKSALFYTFLPVCVCSSLCVHSIWPLNCSLNRIRRLCFLPTTRTSTRSVPLIHSLFPSHSLSASHEYQSSSWSSSCSSLPRIVNALQHIYQLSETTQLGQPLAAPPSTCPISSPQLACAASSPVLSITFHVCPTLSLLMLLLLLLWHTFLSVLCSFCHHSPFSFSAQHTQHFHFFFACFFFFFIHVFAVGVCVLVLVLVLTVRLLDCPPVALAPSSLPLHPHTTQRTASVC